mgnify:FL=1
MDALHTIMRELRAGKMFGKAEHGRVSDYFWCNMVKDGPFIHYRNFGQSAIRCNLEELSWLIKVIFRTTPEKFLAEHECIGSWEM